MAADSEIKWYLYCLQTSFSTLWTTKCDEWTDILHLKLLPYFFFFQRGNRANEIDTMCTKRPFRAHTCLPEGYHWNAKSVAPVHRDDTQRGRDQRAVPLWRQVVSQSLRLATSPIRKHAEHSDAAPPVTSQSGVASRTETRNPAQIKLLRFYLVVAAWISRTDSRNGFHGTTTVSMS